MPTTMICLVGEQAIPNVMGVFLCEGCDIARPDRVVCMVSESTKYEGQAAPEFDAVSSGIQRCLKSLGVPEVFAPGRISPYQVDDICSWVAQQIEQAPDGPCVINVTGGTKLMAQGAFQAYEAARATGIRSVMAMYVDTEEDKVIWWTPDGSEYRRNFNYAEMAAVDVKHYFMAYGVKMPNEGTTPSDIEIQAANLIAVKPGGLSLASLLAKRGANRKKQNVTVQEKIEHDQLSDEGRTVLEALSNQQGSGLSSDTSADKIIVDLSEAMQDFFWQRDWLEIFVFGQVKHAGIYGDSGRRGATVRWPGIEHTGLKDVSELKRDSATTDLPTNELDVVASRGGRILICECKTNVDAPQPEHLYKLQVVGARAGTFVDKVLVTTRSQLTDPDRTPARTQVVRALTYGIAVTGAEELSRLAEIFKDPDGHLLDLKHKFGLQQQD